MLRELTCGKWTRDRAKSKQLTQQLEIKSLKSDLGRDVINKKNSHHARLGSVTDKKRTNKPRQFLTSIYSKFESWIISEPKVPPWCRCCVNVLNVFVWGLNARYLSHLISPGPHKAFRNTRHQFVLIDSFIIPGLAQCEYYFAIEIISSQQHQMTWLLDINTFRLIPQQQEQTDNECLVKASRGREEEK